MALTPSISLFLDCEDHTQFDDVYSRLIDGGAAFMPAGEYPFGERFVWLRDRYGLSWQLILART